MFDEINKSKKSLPKLNAIEKEVGKYSFNGYQKFAIVTYVLCFAFGIILGNLFPACSSAATIYSDVCVATEFNFFLMIFLSFCYKSRRISGDGNPPVYTIFIFCSLHFVAQPLRSCGMAPYMPQHPLTPLPWQAAGCTSPHDRCGRVLRS